MAYIGNNRLPERPDGHIGSFMVNHTKLQTSPVDPTVSDIYIDNSPGDSLAILVGYACHPVIFGPNNLQYSADWPGRQFTMACGTLDASRNLLISQSDWILATRTMCEQPMVRFPGGDMKGSKAMGRRKFLRDSASLIGASSLLGHRSNSYGAGRPGNNANAAADRLVIPLDGAWEVVDSVSAVDIPSSFEHVAPVPGMANLATPPFPDVDAYLSRESIADRQLFKVQPKSELAKLVPGPRQKRNYFWFRKTFRVPTKKELAVLKINKAQFGTAVWLNGKKIGDHYGCFTAGYFNLTEAIDWSGDNQLIVRIGAHPAAAPSWVPTGIDFEKNKWTPGIYDSVALQLCDNPVIETLQVAPHINPREIVVQTKIKNYGDPSSFVLAHKIKAWKNQRLVAEPQSQSFSLGLGEEKTLTETIPLPGAELWTPENPFLYQLETSTGGDSASTRFGVREFRFDTATKRAYLNGKVYFMRGSNITLHRFFDDPLCRSLPWNEAWLRKLLVEIPKRMNWNSFRFCIGPVPDKWLDIADEAGLLIQNEYFIWTLTEDFIQQDYLKKWSKDELIREYQEWVRDNWNHPSVVIWDATNETVADVFGDEIIPAVRPLDLSNRPWENSWNVPEGPDDPMESHPYLFATFGQPPSFQMTDLERMNGAEPAPVSGFGTGHARILNEYGWLWLTRDGTPTAVSKPAYDKLLGPNATGAETLELNAYLLAGLTEFWRAHRNFAGVLHFVYLSSNYPGVYTADHFQDIDKLVLEPHFEDYVREAFRPLGVYIDFWHPTLNAGSKRRFFVMMVNDAYENATGRLVLTLHRTDGAESARAEVPFAIPGLGAQTYKLDLKLPDAPGNFLLKATAYLSGGSPGSPTRSRRKLALTAKRS